MKPPTARSESGSSWAPYVSSTAVPWNLRRVAHLHRRAGFGATWSELQRDLADGPRASIDRLLNGTARSQVVPESFERTASLLADAALASRNPVRLKAWWVFRMIFGPDPLAERLTLLWHNHFATSNQKINDLSAMRRQNEILRRLARAPFGELLNAMVRDPALLVWLDAHLNRRGHPNENLARELMELFSLGIGHYTETDVREVARALTGWSVVDSAFREIPADHDGEEKTVLGARGRWRMNDVVRILLDHPATSRRLAARLCELFMAPGTVDAAGVQALASGFREHDLNIGWAVGTVLRSRAFFAEANLGNHILGPIDYVVGPIRALELFDPSPSTVVLADWAARLGQDLFYPPNVFGWPGGRAWITTRSVIGRANFATALVGGTLVGCPQPVDALSLAERHHRGRDLNTVIAFYAELLLGREPGAAWREQVLAELGPKSALGAETARRVVYLILASPEAQLG